MTQTTLIFTISFKENPMLEIFDSKGRRYNMDDIAQIRAEIENRQQCQGPVACMLRERRYFGKSHDGTEYFSAWSEWSPATLSHGQAVTSLNRNTPEIWQMMPLYAAPQPAATPPLSATKLVIPLEWAGTEAEYEAAVMRGEVQAVHRTKTQPAASAEPVIKVEPLHPDDLAVDSFACAMKEKLALARTKGRSGWQACDPAELSAMLRNHVDKGDPRDVANFCMFLWNKDQPITAPVVAQPQPSGNTGWLPLGLRAVAAELLDSFNAWESGARVIGNVQAKDGADLMRAVLAASPADRQAQQDMKLDAPAQVGNARFGKGVKWSSVIAAAQRHHKYMTDPQREAERIKLAQYGQQHLAKGEMLPSHLECYEAMMAAPPAAPPSWLDGGDEAVLLAIEDALNEAGSPARDDKGRLLTIPERISALAARAKQEGK
ncbi:hypothetical protein RE432_15090 [Pusillimonas sp. SM2304]|uniref:hypothetical protein n=1 Tax=Pusillimonas sp. SM2304 TaxID=3073241 RepID=UPI002874878B|nr:hypothetical protein [Pusillimonas sp. SM2304]MDS1141765.1 hypothetical protein [Pusillimonas sp. SM2304]